jgi:hypothetical protein
MTKSFLFRLALPASVFVAFGANAEPVTPRNFVRAETDTYFATIMAQGARGEITHERDLAPTDDQKVVRMNLDTLYSSGIFDLTAPVTITMPDTGGRFQSLLVLNEDHLVKLISHDPGSYTLDPESIGTRYAVALVRTFVDVSDPADVAATHAAQDGIMTEQADRGSFEIPDWDTTSLGQVRDALKALAVNMPGTVGRFGDTDEIDPLNYLIGAAVGWGGKPPEAATYVPVTPPDNYGETAHTVTLRDVPVDGLWSVSVYNADGFFEANAAKAYVVNDGSAEKNPDGSVTIRFGGDPGAASYLYTPPGWPVLMRFYQPGVALHDGSWPLPG